MQGLSRRELQIFLTVFLIISVFAQVYSQSEYSRIDLTRSIVERGSLDIGPYRNNTADRSYFNGTYYSDKEPGLPFAGAAIYGIWRTTYSVVGDTAIVEEPRIPVMSVRGHVISVAGDPGGFYLSVLIVLILFTSTLAFGLLCVLVYRFSGVVLGGGWLRLVVVFGFAFGTPLTHPAGKFLPNALAALLMFASFYLIYRYHDITLPHKSFLAGLLGGLAVIVEPLNAVPLAAVFLFAWRRLDHIPFTFVLGGFVGGLPFMIYNAVLFGAPWRLPRSFLDPVFWPHLQDGIGLVLDPVRTFFVSLRVLFYPYRGLFYWSPLLLLGWLGVQELFERDRDVFWMVVTIFIAGVVLVSSWWSWWHGGFFGPRHMTFLVPFVFVAVLFGVRWVVDRFWWGGWLVVCLVVVSVGINITGTYGQYESELRAGPDKPFRMAAEYQEVEKSFRIMNNPLREYYLPGFLTHGPQSYILTDLYNGNIPPDIRAHTHPLEDRAPGVIVLWTITLFIVLIWHRELKAALQYTHQHFLEPERSASSSSEG